MRNYALIAACVALLYVPLYAALFNACRGVDLGHSTPLVIPAALFGLPLMPAYEWDEEKLNHNDPERLRKNVGASLRLARKRQGKPEACPHRTRLFHKL